jgi:hypothetical protein|tara:strand:- start:54 stop:254 length:201 start_codon:yes stop_codon:yes gene_type:complete
MAVNNLSRGGPDGTLLGQSASDLVGFYGGTTVDQPAAIADATDAATAITQCNLALAALRELNLIAT